jgi:hypothetical protein
MFSRPAQGGKRLSARQKTQKNANPGRFTRLSGRAATAGRRLRPTRDTLSLKNADKRMKAPS